MMLSRSATAREPGLWGNLTDLANLFCDILDGTIEQLEDGLVEEEDVVEESAVVDDHQTDSEFGQLITEITGSGKATTLNYEEQYDDWYNTMCAVVSEGEGTLRTASSSVQDRMAGSGTYPRLPSYRHGYVLGYPKAAAVCADMVSENRFGLAYR